MANLVIIEHDNQTIHAASLSTIAAAQQIGGAVDVLVLGENIPHVAEQAAKIEGVNKVWVADAASLAHGLAENVSSVIVDLAVNYSHLLANATTQGKNIMPRVAALLDVMQLSDITAVIDEQTFERPIYAGKIVATVRSPEAKKVITVRSSAFAAVSADGGSALLEKAPVGESSGLSAFISMKSNSGKGISLRTAKTVVSGGRGLDSRENYFALLTPLAEKLNAALGASRVAVDSGYCPNSYQVGQTGKVVAPDLYLAIGISGAVQHLAGMKESKVIVAINNDPAAPIFQVADYGLVADLHVAVPELTAAL